MGSANPPSSQHGWSGAGHFQGVPLINPHPFASHTNVFACSDARHSMLDEMHVASLLL